MRAFMEFLGPNDMMAYLAMMAPRLVELHRAHRIELKGPSLRKRQAVSAPAEGGGQSATG